MKIAIFLGAGASKAEGGPLQSELFIQYFRDLRADASMVVDEMEGELRTFFWKIFHLDVDDDSLTEDQFPTFEEAIGILDLATLRQESFKGFSQQNQASNSGRIGFLRNHLIMAMTKQINRSLMRSKDLHQTLVNQLKASGRIGEVSFISTNYDILIDNALGSLHTNPPTMSLDYGVEFTNFDVPNSGWVRPIPPSILLLKLHGSLNWLYCPTCNTLTLTPYEKGVMRLLENFENAFCERCMTVHMPIIVPPTYFKNMSNVFLATVWNKTEQVCRDADIIVFAGYSFPDADIHIKYLLKRAQTNREMQQRYVVVNSHINKNELIKAEEAHRYRRFLGQRVTYTPLSFEDFAANPETAFH